MVPSTPQDGIEALEANVPGLRTGFLAKHEREISALRDVHPAAHRQRSQSHGQLVRWHLGEVGQVLRGWTSRPVGIRPTELINGQGHGSGLVGFKVGGELVLPARMSKEAPAGVSEFAREPGRWLVGV